VSRADGGRRGVRARTADPAAGPWGPWRFDGRCRVLVHANGYEIDLAQSTTSAEVLDWIVQVAGKSWGDDTCLAQLVRAFDDLLQPQATLCSFGLEKGPINIKAVLTWTAAERRERMAVQRAVDAYITAERQRRGDPHAVVAVPLGGLLGADEAPAS
jgi:hypothetical protein